MKRIVASLFVLVGCQTAFTGSPHIDPAACQQRCAGAQLQMTGMVYMGEYSSACICEIPRPAAAPPPMGAPPPTGAPPSAVPGASGAAAGAAAGVVMQMRRANQNSSGGR